MQLSTLVGQWKVTDFKNVRWKPGINKFLMFRNINADTHFGLIYANTKNTCDHFMARIGEKRNSCGVLVVQLEGKKPFGWPRRGWEDNIKMDLTEIGCGGMDCIHIVQNMYKWPAVSTSELLRRHRFNWRHSDLKMNWKWTEK